MPIKNLSHLNTSITALSLSKDMLLLALICPQPGKHKAVSRLEREQSTEGTGADNNQRVKSLNYSKLLCVFSLTVFT